MSKRARCNRDGKPVHPGDAAAIARFAERLALPEDEKRDPRWHEFLGITAEDLERAAEDAENREEPEAGS